MTNYKSISSVSKAELIINKSNFIAISKPVTSEEEVNKFLTCLKNEYSDASHVCYAYSLLNGKEKAQDDGEPSGTAGLPILNCVKKKSLQNIIIVVIRYFGGVKLGAGGLIRAYSKAASKSLGENKIIEYNLKNKYVISLSYEQSKLIPIIENQNFIKVVNKSFEENVLISLLINEKYEDKLQETLNNLFNENIKITLAGQVFEGE